MIVRLGYVAITLKLEDATTSSPVTYKRYSGIESETERFELLKRVTQSNLEALIKVLNYNIREDIHFYRLTSKLVPLATHGDVLWNYEDVIKPQCQEIAAIIRDSNMRVDAHPDQFNVLNSVNPSVIKSSIETLEHQLDLFRLFELKDGKLVLHVGGKAGGKDAGLQRFKETFKTLSPELKRALILENDDKTYTAKDVLGLCQDLNIPMVLDVHHHRCCHDDIPLETMLEAIFKTWDNEVYPPKLHYSTPREGGVDRRHADFIDADDFISFIELAAPFKTNIDMMLEAKQKDLSIYQLVEDIKKRRPNWKWLDQTTFECE